MVCGVVLAAGAGRRFGANGPKQLAPVAGRPLLEHALAAALAAPSLEAVFLVVGAEADRVLSGCETGAARAVRCEDWAEGQSRALRAGLSAAAAAGADAAVIMLGDEPLTEPAAIDAVVAARDDGFDAVRACYDGVAGHPTLLEQPAFAAASNIEGDSGARALLETLRVGLVSCRGVRLDVDTEADLARAGELLGARTGSE